MLNQEKKLLIHWSAWFFLGHAILFWIIGVNYFFAVAPLDFHDPLDYFVLLSFLGHMAVLAFWPSVLMLLLILTIPHKRSLFLFAAISMAVLSSLLVLDVMVYNLYRYHLNGPVLTLAYHGITDGTLGLSFYEKMIPPILIVIFVTIELCYAHGLWKIVKKNSKQKAWFKHVIAGFALLFYLSYVMIVLQMNPAWLRNYIERTRFLPFYVNAITMLMPKSKEHLALIRIDEKNPLRRLNDHLMLQYPKHALQFQTMSSYLNVVIIGIDAWRFDMLNAEVTPFMKKFSDKAWVFQHHMSGGNSTGPGIFSLFYGLPAQYEAAMIEEHQAPLLLQAFKQHHYDMGIFSSAPLNMPPIDQSVFQDFKDLHYLSNAPVQLRDQFVVDQFKSFLQTRDEKKPFFSFLFFDAAHSYCGPEDVPGPFQPAALKCNRLTFKKDRDYDQYLNRYKNALLTVDARVKETIEYLETHHLMKNTVIMIVGDHGEEFDDANKGFYGHASNFSRYQIQTPLLIYWPNETPQKFNYTTSHFDVVPTIMKKLLGCTNPLSDYALGSGLLDAQFRPYFIVSSYVNFGVVEPDRITTIYSTGNYHIESPEGALISDNMLDIATMKDVFAGLGRFYRGG